MHMHRLGAQPAASSYNLLTPLIISQERSLLLATVGVGTIKVVALHWLSPPRAAAAPLLLSALCTPTHRPLPYLL